MAIRPRFSLLSLMLITALVCGSVAHWRLRKEHTALQLDRQELRDDLGYLVVHDPKKGYVRQGHSNEDLTWKYRVYLPEGSHCWLYRIEGTIPRKYYAARHTLNSGSLGAGLSDITFSLREVDGQWTVFINAGSRAGRHYISNEIGSQIAWRSRQDINRLPHEQREFDPSKPIVFFQQTWSEDDATQRGIIAFLDATHPDIQRNRAYAGP